MVYDVDPHAAEIYDQVEAYSDDVALIRDLICDRGPLRILEPFCGTGRILIPLARDGHELVGLDQARGMLAQAATKIKRLPENVQRKITLIEADVTRESWPRGFDLVILGGNCLYELATPGEQEGCIASAATSLRPGGYLYVDNEHMEGNLDQYWRAPEVHGGFPTGACVDGTRLESTIETIWYDAPRRLVRLRRHTKITLPDGRTIDREYIQQKHPVSAVEVKTWLADHDFAIKHTYGDWIGNPYTDRSIRAIFWANKAR